MRNRDLDQDASTKIFKKFQLLCNRMFSPISCLSSIFSGIRSFAHTPQTFEGRRCLHCGIMIKV